MPDFNSPGFQIFRDLIEFLGDCVERVSDNFVVGYPAQPPPTLRHIPVMLRIVHVLAYELSIMTEVKNTPVKRSVPALAQPKSG